MAKLNKKACDACGSETCPDKHLCDVVLPSYPCPRGRAPALAEVQANTVAYGREKKAKVPARGGQRVAKWSPEEIRRVQQLHREGESFLKIGTVVGLHLDPFKAKNAAAGIIRRHGKGEDTDEG